MPLVTKIGSGRPILCLHGSPGDRETWARVAALRPEGYSLWLMEFVDHGDAPDSEEGVVAYERDLESVIASAGAKVVLCGLSLGAFLAIRMANKLGDRIERIVASGGFVEFSPEEMDMRRRAVAALRAGTPTGALLASMMDSFVPRAELDAETERIIRRVEEQSPARFIRAIERIFQMGVGETRLKPYATPTTLLHARGDTLVPLHHGEQLAALGSDAKLVVLEAGSHMLPLSHAQDFARELFR